VQQLFGQGIGGIRSIGDQPGYHDRGRLTGIPIVVSDIG
jgi:hypothetical protein